ncbi:unnamed protein product [Brassicogethes aeneus]|uniref:Uncharacterized protein n=1 Tax=Brassicogethes aeneus TaxID=1431903 RepID=A0A9P0FQW5_BRAAE|nr:unnamed protein product [Brassicogethes aeneus]
MSKIAETQQKNTSISDNLDAITSESDTHTKSMDNNLTISTKLSTDQLICKTPQLSPSISVKSLKDETTKKKTVRINGFLYLGILQVLFGILMMVFGVLVILHRASLSQYGGGFWGGGLAVATGISGILSAAKTFCPLKSTAQTVAHTVYLALSLISLAVSQLVVVIAATGLARDVNIVDPDDKPPTIHSITDDISIELPSNYHSILANVGLLIVAAVECACAAIAAYKSARDVCPCFRKNNDESFRELNLQNSHAIVSSWLGKHAGDSPAPQFYVVAAAPPHSTLGKVSKMSGQFTPVFAIPPMMQPQMVRYPLIPAPLGQIPSPIIPPPGYLQYKVQRNYKKKPRPRQREGTPKRSRSKSRSKSRERQITELDVARTYTGLDRTIAEEFIDILDSKNVSTCSDYSCTSSSGSSHQSPINDCNTNSDAASNDFLVNNKV